MSKATTSEAPAEHAPAAGEARALVGPLARRLVRRELLRALGDVARLPLTAGGYLAQRDAERAALARALADLRAPDPEPDFAPPRDRPLTVFLSCAEASGELHAGNALHELRALLAARGAPAPRLVGLGGARLAALGVELAGDPVAGARMGIVNVVAALPRYVRLLERATEMLARARPDVVLLVDSPALHVPLGRIARALDLRVVHYVTPQYWGWAPWRVERYGEAVDLALSILPFEPAWFEARGVRVAHVGHPIVDELEGIPRGDPDRGRDLVLLPGSRRGVIARNLRWMLETVAPLVEEGAVERVVIPHALPELAPLLAREVERAGAAGWARVDTGGLHDALANARAAFSVSGTVLLDLLHHELPAVVVYRLGSAAAEAAKGELLLAPWFSSPNLLAGREVLPEFCFHGEGPRGAVRSALRTAVRDDAWRARCRAGLAQARARLGGPGASRRAAAHALAIACTGRAERAKK